MEADGDAFSHWVEVIGDAETSGMPVEPNRDWVWREDRMHALLATEDADVLFVSGCAPNMGAFLHHFDHVVLLSAPAEVMVARLGERTNNPYGKHPDELARVLHNLQSVEPLLRRVADHEIDTLASLDEVITTLLQLAESEP